MHQEGAKIQESGVWFNNLKIRIKTTMLQTLEQMLKTQMD